MRACAPKHVTLTVPLRSESFFRRSSELVESLVFAEPGSGVSTLVTSYGSRSSFICADPAALRPLLDDGSALRRRHEVLEAVRRDHVYLSQGTDYFEKIRAAQVSSDGVRDFVRSALEDGLGVIARRSVEDRDYE